MGVENGVVDIDTLIEEGIENFINGRFDVAKSYFTVILTKDVNDRIAKFGMICIDAVEDGFYEAHELFKLFIFEPDEKQDLIMESFSEYNIGNSENEMAEYTAILMPQEEDDNFFAKAYLDAGEVSLAKAELEVALNYNPSSIDNQLLLGRIYEKLGDFDKAIDRVAKAAAIKPFDKKIYNQLIGLVRKKDE